MTRSTGAVRLEFAELIQKAFIQGWNDGIEFDESMRIVEYVDIHMSMRGWDAQIVLDEPDVRDRLKAIKQAKARA